MSDIYHMTPTDTCKSGNFRKVTTNGITAYECADKPDIIGPVIEVFTMLGYILGPIIFLTFIYWIYIKKCKRRVQPEEPITNEPIQNNNTANTIVNIKPSIENKPKDEIVIEKKVEEKITEDIKKEEKPNDSKSEEIKVFKFESDENDSKLKIDDKIIINNTNYLNQESPPASLKVTTYNTQPITQPRPNFQPRPMLQARPMIHPRPVFHPRPNIQYYPYTNYHNYGYNPNVR